MIFRDTFLYPVIAVLLFHLLHFVSFNQINFQNSLFFKKNLSVKFIYNIKTSISVQMFLN